ncbi:PKD domain-containing protein [Pseudomonadota bacterium]
MRRLAFAGALLLFVSSSPTLAVEINYCSEPGLAIPDANEPGVSDVISIDSPGMLVSDLDVLVEIAHPVVGDLSISLENAELSILLYDSSWGTCSNPDMEVMFDDDVVSPPTCDATPPAVFGSAASLEPLANFNGDLLHGDWTLTVTDHKAADAGTLSRWCLIPTTVANSPPWVRFQVSCEGLSCQFTDESTDDEGSVVSWNWDFGDGSNSTEQHPLHQFPGYQVYTVTLVATDNHGGVDGLTQDVDVPEFPPTAAFDVVCHGLICDFTDTSTDEDGSIVAWEWTFGFGDAFSTSQNPQMAFPAGGTYEIWLRVTDDDGYMDSVTKSIVVDPNTPPTADSQSVETLEDTDLLITMTGSDANGDPLGFSVTDGPSHGTLTGRDPQAGLVAAVADSWPETYSPDPDYFGPDEFQFVSQDGRSSSDPATVTINIIPVNDPPRFQPGPSPVWPFASSGDKSHSGWATDIAGGPGDTENGQNVISSILLNDPDGVIATPEPQPGSGILAVDGRVRLLPDGTLEYALTGNSGIAEISITMSDDGGRENGGIDTSDPKLATIEVMHDASALPEASYAWSMQLPELYDPAEACCFDYTGDGIVDNAYGKMAALMASLADDANEVMAGLIATDVVTKLLFWRDLPVLGSPGPFTLEFGNGSWSGPATFPDRVAGMEDFVYDSNGLDGQPPNVQDCVVDSVGKLSCTGDALTLPLAFLGVQQNLAGTTLGGVQIEGSYSNTRNDCAGNCSVDETAAVEPLVHGGFRIGGYMPLDEYFSALNETYQSCVCFGDGDVQLFEYGEGQIEYEFDCTAEGNQAAECSACKDLFLDMICGLGGGLVIGFADVDSNDNGIDDSMSVGVRMAVSGANIVGCRGTNCVPKPDEIFKNGFEGRGYPADGLYLELVWDTPGDQDQTDTGIGVGADLDLHLRHELANDWFDATYDCFWSNSNPDWGVLFDSSDDPDLALDDSDGAGPEIIHLENPELGVTYRVGAHYSDDHGFGPSVPTARLFWQGGIIAELTGASLDATGYFWEAWDFKNVNGTLEVSVINSVTAPPP